MVCHEYGDEDGTVDESGDDGNRYRGESKRVEAILCHLYVGICDTAPRT